MWTLCALTYRVVFHLKYRHDLVKGQCVGCSTKNLHSLQSQSKHQMLTLTFGLPPHLRSQVSLYILVVLVTLYISLYHTGSLFNPYKSEPFTAVAFTHQHCVLLAMPKYGVLHRLLHVCTSTQCCKVSLSQTTRVNSE